MNIITYIQENAVTYGVKILVAIVIFLVGRLIAKGARAAVRQVMIKAKIDSTLIGFLGNLVYASVLVLVLILALTQLGVETTSLVAVLGAAGLAVGLALQGSLSNFASGILLIVFRPIRVGDFIEAGGATGTVRDIQVLTTQLTTADNKLVIVPNSKIMGDKIVNYDFLGRRRIDFELPVASDQDAFGFRDKMQEVVTANKRILHDPAPSVQVSGSSKADAKIIAHLWVNAADYDGVRASLEEELLRQAG
ncbi:MAG: mechanosensitive ion channel [Verrucomicrobia bacterium]|nr:mechanosensitive ion channel [Verrucomicrobiota bacterium]MBV9275598.1 mechanosensitive ion channel [Verrucomicrobiota bacterium]